MFLVGALALSITACGGKETEEANSVLCQSIVGQNQEIEDNKVDEISNTAVEVEIHGNASREFETDVKTLSLLEMPVFSFAYSEKQTYSTCYMANNSENGGREMYEFYQLEFQESWSGIDGEEGYKKVLEEYNDWAGYSVDMDIQSQQK